MRSKILILIALIFLLASCAKGTVFNAQEMESKMPSESLEYKEQLSLQEIEKLKPQLKFPIILAVTQPSRWKGWTVDEIKVIESWGAPLKKIGFIKELIILPESFSHHCGWQSSYFCKISADRKTAARFNADALLVMSTNTENDSYSNPLSIFNVTIIGMWIAPGHHRNSHTIVEGTLIDNRNEYLYAFARAHGEEKKVRPYVYTDWDLSMKDSRLKALKKFGEKMISQLKENPPKQK